MELTRGLTGRQIAEAVGVKDGHVSRWRKGDRPTTALHAPTRERIEAILAQPGWKYVPAAPPSVDEEREAEQRAAYAAGVLWSIAQDADHLAKKAREAHARITKPGAAEKLKRADAMAAAAVQAIAEKNRLGVSARHGRRQGPPKRA